MTGPACPVTLNLASERELFPAFLEQPKGNPGGNIEPDGKARTLSANIRFDPRQPEEGRFHLTVDRLQRALWYKTLFRAGGEVQIAIRDNKARVRFERKLEVSPNQRTKIHVQFAVDNAPDDARLKFRLGEIKGGKLVDEVALPDLTPKNQHIGFEVNGKEGAIVFDASVSDWDRDIEIPVIRGLKHLVAELRSIDPSTAKVTVLDRFDSDLLVDDRAPQNPRIIEFPKKIPKGLERVPVKATVDIPESGIKEVVFIQGPPSEFDKPDVDKKTIPGKQNDSDPGVWEGMLKLDKDQSGKLVISARFTSGTGVAARSEAAEAEIDEPPPAPAAAAAAPQEPGKIEGRVTELDYRQPDLPVYLIDLNAKDKDESVKMEKTKSDGTYEFPDLKPGKYRIYCIKKSSGRKDDQTVTVPSGKTVKQDLDLLLR
jgi:hypothetical protein